MFQQWAVNVINAMSSSKVRQFYEVQKVLRTKLIKNVRYYLIKWKGYSEKESTWQPEAHVAHLTQDIDGLKMKKRQKSKDQQIEVKCKKIVKEKKKTNVQKIKEYLNSKSKELYKTSNQSLNTTVFQKNKPINIPIEQKHLQAIKYYKQNDSQVCIVDKIEDSQNGTSFKIYKDKTIFEMSQKQTKIMFPFQLSFFYEQKIRKVLFTKGKS